MEMSADNYTVAQACMNIAACLGAIVGPMAIGALTKRDPINGWRDFYVRGRIPKSLNTNGILTSSVVDSNGHLGSYGARHLRRLQAS